MKLWARGEGEIPKCALCRVEHPDPDGDTQEMLELASPGASQDTEDSPSPDAGADAAAAGALTLSLSCKFCVESCLAGVINFCQHCADFLGKQTMSRGNVEGEWCRECQDGPVAGCLCENCAGPWTLEVPAQARLFYRQFPPDESFNFILDLAEQEFGMTFSDDMTPRTRLMHDTLADAFSAAAAAGDVAAAGDAAAAGAPLSLSLCKFYAKLCVPGEGAAE